LPSTTCQTIDDIVDQTIGRALDQLGLESGTVRRWTGVTAARADGN
jgi:3-polyprenyl-4-hydroxybenzoate decarboxylase